MPAQTKPTALKNLEGTTRPDRANPHEPMPTPGIPPMPEHWTSSRYAEDRKEWEWAVREIPDGVLTLADASMLELYCELRATLRRMRRRGQLPNANLITQVRALASSFGLEPSSRARLVVKPPENEDPFGKMLVDNRQN